MERWLTPWTTPSSFAAAIAQRASVMMRVSNLRANTDLPVAAAQITCAACSLLGVAGITASRVGSAMFVEVANPAHAMLAAKIGGWLGAASVCRGEADHLVTAGGRRSLLESCCRVVLVAMCSAPRSDSWENAARLSLRLRPR